MKALFFVLLAATPEVVSQDDCNGRVVDENATCIKVCEGRLKKKVHKVEPLGKTGASQQRVCACYLDRVVVVDEDPLPTPEKKP